MPAFLHGIRDDLFLKPSLPDCRRGTLLAEQGELVLLLAGDAVLLCYVFCRRPHVQVPKFLERLGARLGMGRGGLNEKVIAAINCSAHAGRVSKEELRGSYLELLRETAQDISGNHRFRTNHIKWPGI